MKTNDAGRILIVDAEGFRLTSYPDPDSSLAVEIRKPLSNRKPNWESLPGDPWTIGIGATGPDIVAGLRWTPDQAWARFESDLGERERQVLAAVKVALNENQFAALVSWVFNLGIGELLHGGESGAPSELLTKINAADYMGAANEFTRWCYSRGKKSNGLLARRLRERQLFLKPAVPKKTISAA